MKVKVDNIPDEGLVIGIGAKEEWVLKLLPGVLATEHPVVSSAEGEVSLTKTEDLVSVQGNVLLDLKPFCDRCGETFVLPHAVSFSLNLAPRREFIAEMRTKGDKEIELKAEDLEFGFYDQDEVDLGRIVGEQLVLGLPLRFLCRDDCRGLCPRCGTNLNEKTCACSKEEIADFRWEALKGLKPRQ